MSVRAFIAVDIDSPEVVRRVEQIQREVLGLGVDVKLVERENLHITLRFLGEVPQGRINDIARALAALKHQRFEIRLVGLGVFPHMASPRVLWVGVAQGAEELTRLANAVRAAVDKYAEHREERDFTPHLTIGRVKSGRNVDKLRELVERHKNTEFGAAVVDKVKLKRSVLTPRGPIYSDLFVQVLT
ncbi:RNA 2',3'-cyclic phosphodiesterase [Pyrobaculum neutrophilum]|uniref:RNA 2',3'-cyclic phosphodiesterase n=1 Tax=Pyrobaculum neutrophilum (strain DSM 2338 / JCM 9278 / NBRC 100436 / V24Sta) TaxID=444157 RepID=B1Y9T5_PYRNV|nr:RNA 2',3'-cyclic phosphodiesterase [Pyrobaculum neutrophilum]ACB40485.1 2'-5' RNA ligase [Pyrobaculum neutrophilum V24Sta]